VIVPFEPEHAFTFKLQPSQRHVGGVEYLEALKHHGIALTMIHADKIVACGGIVITPDTGILWGYVSDDCKRSFVALDRVVRKLLENCKLPRVEATVEPEFINGCRWLSLLGFKLEKPLLHYGPNGETHLQYVRQTWLRG